MAQNIEELHLLVDLATEKGKMEQANNYLKEERVLMQNKLAEQEAVICQQKDYIKQLEDRIRNLEALLSYAGLTDTQSETNIILVARYLMLSGDKTRAYVKSLDDSHRMFAGHMLTHTLAEGAPQAMLDEVAQITQLEGYARQDRLTSALEEIVKRPVAETNIYTQSGSTANVGCEMQRAEFKVLQPSHTGNQLNNQ